MTRRKSQLIEACPELTEIMKLAYKGVKNAMVNIFSCFQEGKENHEYKEERNRKYKKDQREYFRN